MSTATATLSLPEQRTAAYAAAGQRAAAAGLVAFKVDADTYEVPSASHAGQLHTVTVTGPRWFDLSCDCKGAAHLACMHRAVVVFARKYGVHAKRPAVLEQAATVVNSLYTNCRDCGKESAAGFTLCPTCAKERNRRWDVQDSTYHLPLARLA